MTEVGQIKKPFMLLVIVNFIFPHETGFVSQKLRLRLTLSRKLLLASSRLSSFCLPVWPDWAIYRTLDNFSKPLAALYLP